MKEDLIILLDDDGNEYAYEHIETVEMDGNEYVLLARYEEADDHGKCCCGRDPAVENIEAAGDIVFNIEDEDEDEYNDDDDTDEGSDDGEYEETEVVIMKVVHGDNGEDSFADIEDEEELEAVFEEFKIRMGDEFDFE
ncbi:MAG: DUF1292 domain-containing protein [Eubacteriales bacterium]|nr:DUF1292 domain-containing protein [Eubacteriales bacterium]